MWTVPGWTVLAVTVVVQHMPEWPVSHDARCQQRPDCLFCPAGWDFADAATACDACDSGQYQPQNDVADAQCQLCPAGKKFASASSCSECSPGKYRGTRAQPNLADCVVGRYRAVVLWAPAICVTSGSTRRKRASCHVKPAVLDRTARLKHVCTLSYGLVSRRRRRFQLHFLPTRMVTVEPLVAELQHMRGREIQLSFLLNLHRMCIGPVHYRTRSTVMRQLRSWQVRHRDNRM